MVELAIVIKHTDGQTETHCTALGKHLASKGEALKQAINLAEDSVNQHQVVAITDALLVLLASNNP